MSVGSVHVPDLPGPGVRAAQGGLHPPPQGGGLGAQEPHPQQHRQDIRRGQDGLAGGVLPYGRSGIIRTLDFETVFEH